MRRAQKILIVVMRRFRKTAKAQNFAARVFALEDSLNCIADRQDKQFKQAKRLMGQFKMEPFNHQRYNAFFKRVNLSQILTFNLFCPRLFSA